MSDSWVVQNLQHALDTWNEKLAEIWTLLLQSPEDFKGGRIWMLSVKHFSLKKASKFPVFVKGFSLLSAGTDYASLRIRACSIR